MTDKRIGILGLSADPAHVGHVEISRAAKMRLGLDEVWWIVTPLNPWKKGVTNTPFYHRYAMAEYLTEDERKWLKIRDFEASLAVERESIRSYTMLQALLSIYQGDQFVFMIGSDNWKHFHHWENWRGIMDTLPLVVFNRQDPEDVLNNVPAAEEYRRVDEKTPFAKKQWRLLNADYQDASSTAIRHALARGEGSQYLPPKVLNYISKHRLYT